jgi:putative aminopeptidase FrvX
MKSKKFLESYLNAFSPVAQEVEGQKIWSDYIKNWVDEIHSDNYGTVYGIKKSTVLSNKPYKVVIEAHCDEISWIISNITKDGFIYVNKHGGSDVQIAPSKRVVVHTRKNGLVPGAFGWPAIHTRKTDHVPTIKNIFIDLGVDSDKKIKELGVEVGNIVTFDDPFTIMGDYYVGRSLDNKIGGYIIAEVGRRLKENNIELPYDLYIVNSVQEEVGLFGAKMIAQTIQPDVAIVTDVCHITHTPMIDVHTEGSVKGGKGGVLAYTAQNHRKLTELIREVADNEKIKYQLSVGSYGNDTMGFFLANGGIPTTIISTPLKYMHTTVESAHKKDVESVIDLFYHSLLKIEHGQTFKYHNF